MHVEIRYNYRSQNYWVNTMGKNGETLSSSETFKTKQKAIKNIIAQMKTWVDQFMPQEMNDNVNVLVKEEFSPFKQYFLFINGTKSTTGL